MNETWKLIPWSGQHEVSDFGNVRSLAPINQHLKSAIPRPMRIKVNKDGYHEVHLRRKGFKRRTVTVHKLVAEAFIGPVPTGMQINHIDGNKSNNRPGNLEYVSGIENIRHAQSLGLRDSLIGDRNHNAKLRGSQIQEIRRRLAAGETCTAIAAEYGVSQPLISQVKLGRIWKHTQGESV